MSDDHYPRLGEFFTRNNTENTPDNVFYVLVTVTVLVMLYCLYSLFGCPAAFSSFSAVYWCDHTKIYKQVLF